MRKAPAALLFVIAFLSTGSFSEAAKDGSTVSSRTHLTATWSGGKFGSAQATVKLCDGIVSCNQMFVCPTITFKSPGHHSDVTIRDICTGYNFTPQSFQCELQIGAVSLSGAATAIIPIPGSTWSGTVDNGSLSVSVR